MVAVVQEVKIDPFASVRSSIKRFLWTAVVGFLLSLALIAGVVTVVVYTGMLSIRAFEELPRYRVNHLTNDYNDAVKSFDKSWADTKGLIVGEEANLVLTQARSLAESVLQSEKDLAAIVTIYGETMNAAAGQIGGTLEWKRYFQSQIDSLQRDSDKRQEALAAQVAQFPQPAPPPSADETDKAPPTVQKKR